MYGSNTVVCSNFDPHLATNFDETCTFVIVWMDSITSLHKRTTIIICKNFPNNRLTCVIIVKVCIFGLFCILQNGVSFSSFFYPKVEPQRKFGFVGSISLNTWLDNNRTQCMMYSLEYMELVEDYWSKDSPRSSQPALSLDFSGNKIFILRCMESMKDVDKWVPNSNIQNINLFSSLVHSPSSPMCHSWSLRHSLQNMFLLKGPSPWAESEMLRVLDNGNLLFEMRT